jgi:glycosyltransferase involved in cell wall biosynthesis
VPPSRTYREHEGNAIRAWLGPRLDRDPPDVIIVGSETFALYVPDVARVHGVPCVLLVQGGPSTAILAGTYPPALAAEFLRQYRKMARLITMADHWAASLQVLDLPPITVIPNPVDLDRFAPRPKDRRLCRALRVQPRDVVVLHASNLNPVKRPLDLVRSAERALAIDPRLLYVVAGEGPLRGAMEAACRKRGIRHRFRFPGWVEHARMPALMSLADVVAMPSEHETQALVYLETQASSRPLVASAIPAALEVITPGRTGCVFALGDADELARLTVALAASGEVRERIGLRARASVARHALPAIVRRYSETIEQIGTVEHQTTARARRIQG